MFSKLSSDSSDSDEFELDESEPEDDSFGLFGLSGFNFFLLIGDRDLDRLVLSGEGVREPYLLYVSGLILRLRFFLALFDNSTLTRLRPQILLASLSV